MLNHVFTEEQRRKMAKISLENSRKSERFNTKIQLKVDDILDGISCNYIREYILDYYAVDNYL
jgi:tRNA A58 N-methylase Trm61